jgi:hypothetical protein
MEFFLLKVGLFLKMGVGLRVSEQTVPCEAGRTKGGKILFQLDPSGIYKYNIHKINNSMKKFHLHRYCFQFCALDERQDFLRFLKMGEVCE